MLTARLINRARTRRPISKNQGPAPASPRPTTRPAHPLGRKPRPTARSRQAAPPATSATEGRRRPPTVNLPGLPMSWVQQPVQPAGEDLTGLLPAGGATAPSVMLVLSDEQHEWRHRSIRDSFWALKTFPLETPTCLDHRGAAWASPFQVAAFQGYPALAEGTVLEVVLECLAEEPAAVPTVAVRWEVAPQVPALQVQVMALDSQVSSRVSYPSGGRDVLPLMISRTAAGAGASSIQSWQSLTYFW